MPVTMPDVSIMIQVQHCVPVLPMSDYFEEKKVTSSSNVSFVQGELYNQVFHLLMSMADEVQCGTALAEGWTT